MHLKNRFLGGAWAPTQYPPKELEMKLLHELIHATEAVAYFPYSGKYFNRSGLRVNESGRSMNEGMTQFLAEYAQQQVGDSYRLETLTMYQMYLYHYPLFTQLYKTYHGEIDNPHELETAIKKYQRIPDYFNKNPEEANHKLEEIEP